jgi:hypothetical protein
LFQAGELKHHNPLGDFWPFEGDGLSPPPGQVAAAKSGNDGRTWRAYQQRYWPTRYLLDKNGRIRYKHVGEGAYEETEIFIQALMAEPAGGP